MAQRSANTERVGNDLERGSLNAFSIAFLVLAVAAPIGAITGPAVLGVVLGNGTGMVGTYVIVSCLIAIFAIGYAAISRHVRQTGAFYSYVQRGLGKVAGGGAALIALLTYLAAMCTVTGAFGFFGSLALAMTAGVEIPWWVISIIGLIIVGILGRLRVGVSSALLVVLMIIELLFFLALDAGVLAQRGLAAFDIEAFNPVNVFNGGFPIAIMFAIFTFAGIEVAAIYSEESQSNKSSVKRATFGAIILIGLFYIITMWSLLSGIDDAVAVATEAPGDFAFIVAGSVLGEWASTLMMVLVVISLFASMIALNQALSRYTVALSRDRLLPASLAKIDQKMKAPANASMAQVLLVVAVVLAFAISGADPLMTLVTSLGGVATLGTITLWVLASISIVVYFRKMQDKRIWQTLIAPLVSAAAFFVLLVLAVSNYSYVTGVENPFINALWVLVPAVAVIGLIYVSILRKTKPDTFDQIGTITDEELDANLSGV